MPLYPGQPLAQAAAAQRLPRAMAASGMVVARAYGSQARVRNGINLVIEETDMHMPGFTAEMSLCQSARFFVAEKFNEASPTTVIAQRIKLPTNPGWKECL